MDNFFKGKLDDIRIYNCPLTPQEIISLHSEFSDTAVTYNLAMAVNPPDAGIVTGAGNYAEGEKVSIVAAYQLITINLEIGR